jgi:sulfhydrogenase subunit alpha
MTLGGCGWLHCVVSIEKFRDGDAKNVLMALDPREKYGFVGDYVLVSDGSRHSVEDYLELTNEQTIKHSHARFSSYNGSPFMVGALARILLNKDKLKETARDLYDEHRSCSSKSC